MIGDRENKAATHLQLTPRVASETNTGIYPALVCGEPSLPPLGQHQERNQRETPLGGAALRPTPQSLFHSEGSHQL